MKEKKYIVVFNVEQYEGKNHYNGIIYLDSSNVCQFGLIFDDSERFNEWYVEKCRRLAQGAEFMAVGQQISTEKIEEPFCWDN